MCSNVKLLMCLMWLKYSLLKAITSENPSFKLAGVVALGIMALADL